MEDGFIRRSPVALFALLFTIGLLATWALPFLGAPAVVAVMAGLAAWIAGPKNLKQATSMWALALLLFVLLQYAPVWYLLGAPTNPFALRNIARELAAQNLLHIMSIYLAFYICQLARARRSA